MKQLTALNQVMRDIKKHHPNLFDLNTAQGREFVSRFHKYLEVEKEQIKSAYGQGVADESGEIIDATKDSEQYYIKTYEK